MNALTKMSLVLLLTGCGADNSKSSTSSSAVTPWALSDISGAEYNCSEAMDANANNYPHDKSVTYCDCMVEIIAKRWSTEDYIRDQTADNQSLVDDGTAASCKKTAGL